jgi:hypothetical protein
VKKKQDLFYKDFFRNQAMNICVYFSCSGLGHHLLVNIGKHETCSYNQKIKIKFSATRRKKIKNNIRLAKTPQQ